MIVGGEAIRDEILEQLRARGFVFKYMVHEPTPTSQDSARVRGTKIEQGVKALILRGRNSGKNYQFNLPSHLKLDMKAVAEIVQEKCDFEDPKVIFERFGLVIGGVPPFGHLFGIECFFDEGIALSEQSAFNCGLTTESIVMGTKDLIDLVKPKMARFCLRVSI